ncbi:universal stress protein [Salegentibacter sediminis]|uniref:universal stress protein n=1 Tax=Salegentibacter sediminis TaxID=1930251 RepID=UPI0009BE10D7|nr:universal stress protein [Salegentibacter sediminis]
MRTIIVALDFSHESENALNYAAEFAKNSGARLVLFNSFSIPIHVANSIMPAETLKHLEQENIEQLDRKAQEIGEKFDLEVGYESGLLMDVSRALEKIYKKYEADLIVMGMGAQSIAQDLFGNTTTEAIMKLSYPVLAVPAKSSFSGIHKILFAIDRFREDEQLISEKIKELARVFEAGVEVLHVKADNRKRVSKELLENALAELNYNYMEIESEEIIGEIEKEIKKLPADILVMIPHKYSFWESLIHRSKTRMMASRAAVPVLSLPFS